MDSLSAFSEHLRRATAAIGPDCFHLPISGGDPVYRERVYCYELYAQLRKDWPLSEFTLNGEVDKSGHAAFKELGLGALKPDFLVHVPGGMDGNLIAIEVKPVSASKDGIQKDFSTLSGLVSQAGYKQAVYLFYGEDTNERLLKRLEPFVSMIAEGINIELWLHSNVGHAAERLGQLDKTGLHAF